MRIAIAAALLLSACHTPDPRLPTQGPRPTPPLVAPVRPAAASQDTCAALKVLAESDRAQLEALGLSPASLARLEAFRAGADGRPNTADDRFLKEDADLALLALPAEDLARLPGPACGRVPLQLLAINDFHGAIEPPTGRGGLVETEAGPVDAGGAEYLATWIARLHAEAEHSLMIAAGDNVGATPLVSAAFQDEPTIEALNLVGLALSAVGNHEFDEGLDELVRLQQGGCHPSKGCFGDTPFGGARFGFLAANVVVEATGETAFPAYAIRRFGKVPVAFIGMTLEGTAEIVAPAGIAGLSFRDEIETVNALVPKLRALGVEAIVVMVHEGGFTSGGINGCEGISGPLFDIVRGLDRHVDVVVAGHTNATHVCDLDGILVTSAGHNGRLVTDIDLILDERTHHVVARQAKNLIISREVERDPRLTELLGKYQGLVRDVARRVVTTIPADILRKPSPAGEMPLGQVIADAQVFAEADPSAGGAEIGWINSGGVRADLLRAPQRPELEGGPKPGEVTYGDLFAVQPFSNALVTMTLTGAQVKAILEAQFALEGELRDRPKMLQTSSALRYAVLRDGTPGDKVRDVTVSGRPLDLERRYRVVMNEFLANGGDGFSALKDGTERRVGVMDVDALEHYLKRHPGLRAPEPGRVRFVP